MLAIGRTWKGALDWGVRGYLRVARSHSVNLRLTTVNQPSLAKPLSYGGCGRETIPASSTFICIPRPGFQFGSSPCRDLSAPLVRAVADNGLAVAWVGCMLPCHYLHNWYRKLVTSQLVIWLIAHLREESILGRSIHHSTARKLRVPACKRLRVDTPRVSSASHGLQIVD